MQCYNIYISACKASPYLVWRPMENRLKEIRKEKKIGQGYLVEKLGVSRQSISSIENGRCTPSLELAFDIADLLQMPVEEIFIHENRFADDRAD